MLWILLRPYIGFICISNGADLTEMAKNIEPDTT